MPPQAFGGRQPASLKPGEIAFSALSSKTLDNLWIIRCINRACTIEAQECVQERGKDSVRGCVAAKLENPENTGTPTTLN